MRPYALRILMVVIFLSTVCEAVIGSHSEVSAEVSPQAIGVFPLKNATGSPDLSWLSIGYFADLEYMHFEYIPVGEGNNESIWKFPGSCTGICPDHDLACASRLDLEDLEKIAEENRFERFIWGDYAYDGDNLKMRLAVYEGDALIPGTETTFSKPLSELSDELSNQLLKLLESQGVKLNPHEMKRFHAAKTRSLKAWELSVRGWWTFFGPGFIKTEAIELLNGAVSEDPSFAFQWYYLGVLYDAMDRKEESIESLREAFNSSNQNIKYESVRYMKRLDMREFVSIQASLLAFYFDNNYCKDNKGIDEDLTERYNDLFHSSLQEAMPYYKEVLKNASLKERFLFAGFKEDTETRDLLAIQAINQEQGPLRTLAFEVLTDNTAVMKDHIHLLCEAVQHGSDKERLELARLLRRASGNNLLPIECVAGILRDKSMDIRDEAIDILERIGGSREVVDLVVEALKDPSAKLRAHAVKVLGELGDSETVPKLAVAMKDEDPAVRVEAIEAINKLWGSKAMPYLSAAMDDESEKVRQRALWYLNNAPTSTTVPLLLKALEDRSWEVRETATLRLWRNKDYWNTLPPEIVHKFASILSDRSNSPKVRSNMVILLWVLSEKASTIPYLIEALNDDDQDVRTEAMRVLAKKGVAEVIPRIRSALESSEASERASALEILINFDSTPAVAPEILPRVMKGLDDESPLVRKAAISILCRHTGSSDSVGMIVKMLDDKDQEVRIGAINALEKIGSKEVAPYLIPKLKDESETVRRCAITALGKLDAEDALPQLVEALGDKEYGVRSEAVRTLSKMDSSEVGSHLLNALGSADKKIRYNAAEVLGNRLVQQAVPALIDLLKRDQDDMVRANAAEAIGKIGEHSALPHLMNALKDADSYVRRLAAIAMCRLAAPEDAPEIIALMNGSRWEYAFPGKLLSSISLEQVKDHAPQIAGVISEVAEYSQNLLALAHFATSGFSFKRRLSFIGSVHKADVQKYALTADTILHDIASLKKKYPEEAFEKNPCFVFFAAYLLKEKGCFHDALEISSQALPSGPSQIDAPIEIVLRWVRAEALWRLGKTDEALGELSLIEQCLLPRVSRFAVKNADLSFDAYTATLQGIIFTTSGKLREGVKRLNEAEEMLDHGYLFTITAKERIKKLFMAYRARAQVGLAMKDAEGALQIMEKTSPRTAMEKDAEGVALTTRIQIAIGEGDYETAHRLAEKLSLMKYAAAAGGIAGSASADRIETYTRLKDLQTQVELMDRQIEKAEKGKASLESTQGSALGLTSKQEARLKNAAEDRSTEELRRQRQDIHRELKQFMIGLKKSHPEVSTLVGAEPVEVSFLQERLSREQAVLQYLVLPEKTIIFLISQSNIKIAECTIGQKEIGEKVKGFREAILHEVKSRSAAVRRNREALGSELTKALIEPLLPDLKPFSRLILIPNADLHFLPFGALKDGHSFLAEEFTISYLSASSLLAVVARKSSGEKKLFAIANSSGPDAALIPLKETEAEVQTIGTHFSEKQIYMGGDAKRALLLGRDLRGWHLHLAMHGEAGRIDQTRLALSDGYLTVPDVWGLYLDGSPLVVLSACETNLGERVSGDEVVSLANGFIFAGANCVVSSLWKVTDEHTRMLMGMFYDNLEQSYPKAEALTLAQREMIQSHQLPPYFWAGFVINGW